MKLKKVFVYFMLTAFLLSSGIYLDNSSMVYAMEKNTNNTKIMTSSEITPYAEQTEWRYRFKDGKLQKRLWSITYNKWLTNWEWV